MNPGDVQDDGTILACVPHGKLFVSPEQAERAKQFGWEVVSVVRDDLVIVRRYPCGKLKYACICMPDGW